MITAGDHGLDGGFELSGKHGTETDHEKWPLAAEMAVGANVSLIAGVFRCSIFVE
jgi:hypothetical protein